MLATGTMNRESETTAKGGSQDISPPNHKNPLNDALFVVNLQ